MGLFVELGKLCQVINRRWLVVVGVVAITHIMFQSLLLPYGNALRSMLPNSNDPMYEQGHLQTLHSSAKSLIIRNTLAVDASSSVNDSIVEGLVKDGSDVGGGGFSGHDGVVQQNSRDIEDDFALEEEDLDNPIELVMDEEVDGDLLPQDRTDGNVTSDGVESQESNTILRLGSETRLGVPDKNIKSNIDLPHYAIPEEDTGLVHKEFGGANTSLIALPVEPQKINSATDISHLKSNGSTSVGYTIRKNNTAIVHNSAKKKMRCEMPPKSVTSVDEMNKILARHRRSSRAMRPKWSSPRDQEIVAARSQIENAPIVTNDRDLYAPLFRNVSKFKRSYELMERTLKVYIYKDGNRPIFHVPIMKGLYASEGWFMKLMHGNKRFMVKDPRKAHLFYMPFSSRMLEYHLYVRNSHNRTNLRLFLKDYAEKIAAKYPYWNRTGGADHILVACHDWAPYETRHHMEHCIKALCNADVTAGFKLGRDVSLPETYVRSARNPLRDLGGKPPSRRHILAFYAGSMHGYLRPILLEHWKGKDPDMKIFGPMPPGVASKMNYIQHMKSSKYCICPKGYEVNSPRVVEAIFYECVPVIISDNFVPPFFEVLDWSAFSIILAEKDIPNLKEILTSIPQEKYLEMQLAVRKVQRHFLWHANPMKYDLFHMTLHSIWYNRVYQIKPR
ncbi:hypothetical protein Tsubulata_903174 [Turnera subulata]|uniref:Exostosin GT47 domain-containing protein n=1 Tax=Turnera subulata TaxID=218843 RepID=A0A9Q0FXS1_9ROSI|nr:hypothetical protein Tsubulata_903174 [Turnera subulata]